MTIVQVPSESNPNEKRKKELMASADRIAMDILTLSRNSLFVTLRFLDVALSQLGFISDPEAKGISTTGKHVVYNTNYVIQEYMRDKQSLSRSYLHMVIHCIFRHPFVSESLNRMNWDLAADIAVESIISDLQVKQAQCKNYEEIETGLEIVRNKMKTITAEKVYKMLQSGAFSKAEIQQMRNLFYRDDHDIWWELAKAAAEKKKKEQPKDDSQYQADDEEAEDQEGQGDDEDMGQEAEGQEDQGPELEDEEDMAGEQGDEDPDAQDGGRQGDSDQEEAEDDSQEDGESSDDDDENEASEEDEDVEAEDEDDKDDEDEDDDMDVWSNVEDPDGTAGDDPDGKPDPEADSHPSEDEGDGKGDGESSGTPGEQSREDGGDNPPQSGDAEGQSSGDQPGGEGQDQSGSMNKVPEPRIGGDKEQKQTLGQKKSSSGKGPKKQGSGQQIGEASSGSGGGEGSQSAWQHQTTGGEQKGEQAGERSQQSRQMAEAVQGEQGRHSDEADGSEHPGIDRDDGLFDQAQERQYLQDDQELKDLEARWKEISERLLVDLETSSKEWGDQSNSMLQGIKHINRDKYDYSVFLRKFATFREDIQINPDEFDYVYYIYGLNRYGNMPLIEPLEYKEVKKIHDFVIAIDTSGSCSGEVVQKFLDKTYSILTQTENFFKKINIHIIQCDAEIQNDVKITSKEEFDTYVKHMEFYGFGGTDFRPVFQYVDELVEQREFADLKGLIYFTDGNGTYPAKRPKYETAFVFVDDDTYDYEVPSWAIKLVLETQDILEEVKIN